MHVVRSFIGVDGLEIHQVTDNVVLIGDPVAAMHVACNAGDFERLAAVIPFQQRNGFRCAALLLERNQPAQIQRTSNRTSCC